MKAQHLFTHFPDNDSLLNWHQTQPKNESPEINGHIHTPHSFSAFPDIKLALQMAQNEGIKVLGINDFYTTDGYPEFAKLASDFKIFPLFNIEFMALDDDLQQNSVRVNDPNNPGRIYISGKGLSFPVKMSPEASMKIENLQAESNRQTYQMVEKLNEFLKESNINLKFDATSLHEKLAKGLFRERHIAQAIRLNLFETASSADGRKRLFEKLFSGKELKSPLGNISMVENEIRSVLLKAGGPAFVPEDPKAFLSLEEVVSLIIDAGGIPCYPVLLDDPKGNLTDFEGDKQALYDNLISRNIWSIEFIPGRNDIEFLKEYVTFFNNKGFIITFGTEHNTPELDPLKVTCRGGVPLDDELMRVNHEGAAVIAAHQFLIARGQEGYLKNKSAKTNEKEHFIQLGKAVIDYFFQMND